MVKKNMLESVNHNTFNFMADLAENNSKVWFDSQRERYVNHVREPLKALAGSLSDPISALFPDFSDKPRVSRINNDLRFNPDKAPYKEHIWISFGVRGNSADIFAAVDKNGWTAGCGLSSPKRDDLTHWRRNLIDNHAEWVQQYEAINNKRKLNAHYGDMYKKPLFEDTPANISHLVQTKGVWIYFEPQHHFSGTPEEDFMRAILQLLPLYMFMVDSDLSIPQRIVGLHANISNYLSK